MLSIPYSNRDFNSIFNDIKEIMQTIEPRLSVNFDEANVESIIAKVIAGCVDTLSYNQDSNILEAFPSTARDPRAVFDLLSIVGYTPKTARCCHISMSLAEPNYDGEITFPAFSQIMFDNKNFYSPDSFKCAKGYITATNWYQGVLKSPEIRYNMKDSKSDTLIDNYYPNLSVNVIKDNKYKLPDDQINIDSRTIRIYTEDGRQLQFVENPYLTNITKSSFSIVPSVNSPGYSLVFSKDVSNGTTGNNFYYFYIISEGYDVGAALVPNFNPLSFNNFTPNFSVSYTVETSKGPETANEARENLAYEFGWRDTPKAIITKYDAERAVLQNFDYIAACTVRDGNDYSFCDSSGFDVQIFCKVKESIEPSLNIATASGIVNRLMTHFSRFKALPLNYQFHIDNIQIGDLENVTTLYYWFPDVTIYLKEQIDSEEAAAIINAVNEALTNKFCASNTEFNEVPRIVDIIETIQNASSTILYLDIDGVYYITSNNEPATKEDITCSYTLKVPAANADNEFDFQLNTENQRYIQFNTVKIVNNRNQVFAFDNGDGILIANNSFVDGQGSIDYRTGEVKFKLKSPLPEDTSLYINYKLETPTFCQFIARNDSIKIALESIKA